MRYHEKQKAAPGVETQERQCSELSKQYADELPGGTSIKVNIGLEVTNFDESNLLPIYDAFMKCCKQFVMSLTELRDKPS